MMYLYKRIYALQSQGSRQSHLKKKEIIPILIQLQETNKVSLNKCLKFLPEHHCTG